MLDSFCNLQPTEFRLLIKMTASFIVGPIPEIVTVFTKHYHYPILVDQHYCQC